MARLTLPAPRLFTALAAAGLLLWMGTALAEEHEPAAAPPAWLKIGFLSPPQPREDRSLLLSYRVGPTDGLEKVTAIITLDAQASDFLPTSDRVQEVPLPLPPASTYGRLTAPVNLTNHPWAGSRVNMRLVASNVYGQVSESQAESVVLPQLPFHSDLAQKILKLRSLLYTAPELRIYVRRQLWQLLHTEGALPDDPALALALGVARNQLAPEEPVEKQQEVVQLLWEAAMLVEARYGLQATPEPHDTQAPSPR